MFQIRRVCPHLRSHHLGGAACNRRGLSGAQLSQALLLRCDHEQRLLRDGGRGGSGGFCSGGSRYRRGRRD